MIKDNIIDKLKKDNQQVHRYQDSNGDYGIRVLGRGENLFFQKNEKAFICEIDAGEGLIFQKTITHWDTGKKISKDERNQLLQILIFLYRKFYNDEAKLFP